MNTHLIPFCSESGTTWHSGLDYHEVVPVPKKGVNNTAKERCDWPCPVRCAWGCEMRFFPYRLHRKGQTPPEEAPLGSLNNSWSKSQCCSTRRTRRTMAKMTRRSCYCCRRQPRRWQQQWLHLVLFVENINLTEMVSSPHKACLVYLCSGVLVRHPVQLWHCGISPFWKAVATNCRVQSPWVHFP